MWFRSKQNYSLCSHSSTNTNVCVFVFGPQMLQEVVTKALKHHGISVEHECFKACSKRLFDISKFYLKVGLGCAEALWREAHSVCRTSSSYHLL